MVAHQVVGAAEVAREVGFAEGDLVDRGMGRDGRGGLEAAGRLDERGQREPAGEVRGPRRACGRRPLWGSAGPRSRPGGADRADLVRRAGFTRICTAIRGGEASHVTAFASASPFARSATASSRSRITMSAPEAAALSNRSGRSPGTYSAVRALIRSPSPAAVSSCSRVTPASASTASLSWPSRRPDQRTLPGSRDAEQHVLHLHLAESSSSSSMMVPSAAYCGSRITSATS